VLIEIFSLDVTAY